MISDVSRSACEQNIHDQKIIKYKKNGKKFLSAMGSKTTAMEH
jgi:hypothetical protein